MEDDGRRDAILSPSAVDEQDGLERSLRPKSLAEYKIGRASCRERVCNDV